jgi:hypothetical protein
MTPTRLASLLPLATLLICTTMSGCGSSPSSTSHRTWSSKDSWYCAPPSSTQLWERSRLDDHLVHELISAKKGDAERLPQDAPGIALTDQQAAEFIGEPLPDLPETRPYLTRGVVLNRDMGGFSLNTSGIRWSSTTDLLAGALCR